MMDFNIKMKIYWISPHFISAPAIRFVLRKFGCISPTAEDEISVLEEEVEPESSIFEAQTDTAAAVAARNEA